MVSNYLDDYLHYNSNNESPRIFHQWAAFVVLSTILGNRVKYSIATSTTQKQLLIHPNLLCLFVAPMGQRKSFAKDVGKELIEEVFPDFPMSANSDTREAITKWWASDAAIMTYSQPDGTKINYKPLFFTINEFSNFISVAPENMINFFTDGYNQYKLYRVRTKNQGEDIILNGYMTMIACATTDYITRMLKSKVLSGGIARRILWICSDNYTRIPDPSNPPGSEVGWERVKLHLKRVQEICHGMFRWESTDARRFYDNWYTNLVKPSDPLLAGFRESEHEICLRVAMLLWMCQYDIKPGELILTRDNFVKACMMVNEIKPGMQRLFMCSGSNELISAQQKILDVIEAAGGGLSRKKVHAALDAEIRPKDQLELITQLTQGSGKLKNVTMVRNTKLGWMEFNELWLPERFVELAEKGKIVQNNPTQHDSKYKMLE